MAQSNHVLERIQEWKTNFEKQGEAKLAEIQQLINANDILEAYFQEIDQLPEELRKSNLFEFMSSCETADPIVELSDEPSVSQQTESESRMGQKSNAWANRLRGARKLVPEPSSTNMRTPAYRNLKPIVLKTPAGNVRVPGAITPKVQNGDDIKFRTLRREEVAFSVAGTPVVAGNETESDENIFLVNELLHARDDELTPQTRNVVQGMKRLIGRIRTSEIPEHF
ncbi:Uncharacterized protein BM_BM10451 [Brugia malayi]|uniref:Bm10451 n=1 Tax=Brugia malayi TaxID=6279 RepID=A0A0J9XY80_BRUMA|nr:Uncharacterized protein BM_BM10451 [Brugia malayi]CDP98235.2 Bm10451 [Brugia malayi]VIO97872.1 Uncharacterized protein BM_BM10451 [Brugia malayi]